MATPLIDQREYDRLKARIEHDRLDQLDPALTILLGRVDPKTATSADLVLWDKLRERMKGHAVPDGATMTLPAHLLPTGFTVGTQAGTDDPAGFSDAGNMLVAGPSGSGKTTLDQWALKDAYEQGKQLIIPDRKGDSEFWTTVDESFLTIDEETAWNPIGRKPWHRSDEEHVNEQVERWRAHFYAGETQCAVLRRAWLNALAEHPDACAEDVHRHVDQLRNLHKYYAWQEAVTGTSERFHKIKARYPVAYRTRTNCTMPLNRHVYLPLLSSDPVGDWVLSGLLWDVFQRNKALGIREITTLAVIDEGIITASKAHAAASITGQNPIAILFTVSREFGLRLLVTTASITSLDQLILQNAATIALMPGVIDDRDTRLLGLTPEQARYAKHLPKGHTLCLYPGQLSWAVTIAFQPLPKGLKGLRPKKADDAPSPSTTTIEPGLHDAPPKKPASTNGAALKPTEQRILETIAELGMPLVGELTTALNEHPMTIDRARKRLETVFGHLETGRVRNGTGRGKAGIATALTKTGWQALGKNPPRQNRGGSSFEHRYWSTTIARALGHLEVDINGKSCDVIIRYDPARHDAFLAALQEHAHRLTDAANTLTPGDLIAIEIETHPDDTATNNATKNATTAQLPLSIIAVDGKPATTTKQLQQQLDANLWPTVLVVNVLWLVEYCRNLRKEP